ncbi:MAG: MerR family transcriptional regulator [Lachnospiraceae bacterium]|nr:MerR family transcriptional regulator [Lachnospiraceae bacterium]
MKINEISKLTQVNAETIRMYREKGLLKPQRNPENGYYEYGMQDIVSIFMIRKLRGNNFSLKTIQKMYTNEQIPKLIEEFEQEEANARAEILRLQNKIEMLRIEKQHLLECFHADYEVAQLQSNDTKYDFYDFAENPDKKTAKWLKHSNSCTISIYIPSETLSENLPGQIPVKIGIGSYGTIMQRMDLPVMNHMIVCPPGLYLTVMLRMTQLDYIEKEQLEPLQNYAKEHHMRFVSDTTAYLMNVDIQQNPPVFIFRVRIQVEEVSPMPAE